MTFKKDSRGRIRFTENGIRYDLRRLTDGSITINTYLRDGNGEGSLRFETDAFGYNYVTRLTPAAASKLNVALAAI